MDKNSLPCPARNFLEIISRKWALHIIVLLGNRGKLRFNEFIKLLPGINPKVLSTRLKELEAIGLVERNVLPEIPPRVEYSLTQSGLELKKLLEPIIEWAAKMREEECTILKYKKENK